MKTGILITARLGSTRLERKHLLPVNNKPILYYLINRITGEFEKELADKSVSLIIATSDEPENRKFEDFSEYGASVFYGSVNNIPLRHLQVAEFHSLNAIVSVDGDDILCSPKGMHEVYKALNQNAHYVKTANLPFGMNSSGYSYYFLSSAMRNHVNDTLETGWGRIFNEKELITLHLPFSIQNKSLRFTLDYEEDYKFFKILIEKTGHRIIEMTDEDIVNIVLKEKMYQLNETISKQYWEDFKVVQRQEIEKSRVIDLVENKEKE